MKHTAQVSTQESELYSFGKMLDATITCLPNGLALVDPNFNIIKVNGKYIELLEITIPLSPGDSIPNKVVPHIWDNVVDTDEMMAFLKQCAEDPKATVEGAMSIKQPYKRIKLFSSPVQDDNGAMIGRVVVKYDVTAEEKFAEALKETVEKRTLEFNAKNKELQSTMEELRRSTRIHLRQQSASDMLKIMEAMRKVILEWDERLNNGDLLDYLIRSVDGTTCGSNDIHLLKQICEALHAEREQYGEDLSFMGGQLVRIVRLIEGFREMSRRQRIVEDVGIKKVVAEAIEGMRDGIIKRDIQITQDITEMPTLKADAVELISIFSNVIRNAIQAVDEKKGAYKKQINVTGWFDAERNRINVRISDNGVGVLVENREDIFKQYTTKGREGTGLGLSLSRRIARSYNGDMCVEKSEPGQGATFRIWFELKKGR
ncbi:MAG: GHKL domain-containing protein [Deltaproteobacteria bacterium]|nr:GHKL domain-containing protein [Deltaproteobacteria bacterium]